MYMYACIYIYIYLYIYISLSLYIYIYIYLYKQVRNPRQELEPRRGEGGGPDGLRVPLIHIYIYI